jgi:hypothetical protein
MVHLNFQNFVNAQQAQERNHIGCMEQPTSSATSPGIDVFSFPLSVEPYWLEVPMFWLMIEIINLLQDVL